MKRRLTQFLFYFFVVALAACSNDMDIPDNILSQPKSITGIRKVQLDRNPSFGETAIKGVVISDAKSGNMDERTLVIQEESEEAAIVLICNEPTDAFSMGDEIQLNMEGATLSDMAGELTISDLPLDHVVPTGKTISIAPKITNLPTLTQNVAYWGPILVRLEKINLSGGSDGKLAGEIILDDGIGQARSLILPAADFSDNELPDYVEAFTGILRMENGQISINPRNIDDIQVGLKEMLEDFEDASSTNYDVKTLTFRTGDWTISGGITASTSADLKNGKQSIRLQGTVGNDKREGIIAMEFDLKGVKKLRVSHGIYPAAAETSNVNPTVFDIEMSRDGGKTYTFLKQVEVDIKAGELKTDDVAVNAGFGENVRFRFVNSSIPFANNNKPRISIDDILFEF